MKKTLAIIFGIVGITCILSGCLLNKSASDSVKKDTTVTEGKQTNKKADYSAVNNPSDSWQDATIVVNGIVFQLPVSYKEFSEKTGYEFDEDYDEELIYINREAHKSAAGSALKYKGKQSSDHLTISSDFYNTNDYDTTLDNCMISSIGVRGYSYQDNVKYVNDWCIGSKLSVDDVIEEFGEPNTVTDWTDSKRLHYWLPHEGDGLSDAYFTIEINNENEVIDIELSVYNFDN